MKTLARAAGLAGALAILSSCTADGGQEAMNEADAPHTPVDTAEDAVSTFGLDVDTASYEHARARLREGQGVDRDQIRPEEFVNYFDYDYPDPDDGVFSLTVDGMEAPDWYGEGGDHLMRVALNTAPVEEGERPDVNLTFVIDVSGSMSGEKIGIVRDSLKTLAESLRPSDSVAIVTFNDEDAVLRQMGDVGDGGDLGAAIGDLEASGSTNMHAGLTTGYDIAAEGFDEGAYNRVVLLSDGAANVGPTEHEAILDDLGDHLSANIALLTVGVGRGYDQTALEQLADQGNGWASYFATAEEAETVFGERFTTSLGVVAREAKAQVEFDDATVAEYRLIGYENRALEDDEFDDDSVPGGSIGPGHTVTALYALELTGEEGPLATVDVRWLDPETREPSTVEATLSAEDVVAFDDADPDAGVALMAAAFAEELRAPEGALPVLREACADVVGGATDPTAEELVELIGLAEDGGE
ncbi:vWA domain-containing protein [Salininema proteolyticum]|uniref:von Willebrand factor type A domain-containing protein n=1 Tax=Salininema proteolyticum TaxID=1607685 RepID=A0ABV8TT77_9ACTN